MILAPVRMINNNESKITLYDIEGCTDERDAIKNSESIPSLINITKFFNENYGEKINDFYGTKNEKYDLWLLDNFCDAFISSITYKREMKELHETGIDFDELFVFILIFKN